MMFVSIKQGKYLNFTFFGLTRELKLETFWNQKFSFNSNLERLNVEQTLFGETIEFKMRTFRFGSEGTTSSNSQQQTIDCDLHLEPNDNIVQEQAADCTCYTQEDCTQGRGGNLLFAQKISQMNLHDFFQKLNFSDSRTISSHKNAFLAHLRRFSGLLVMLIAFIS